MSKSLFRKLVPVVAFLSASSFAVAAGGFPQPSICNRSCWSARSPSSTASQMASLNRAVIHHTATASDWNTTSQSTSATKVRAIQNYHMDSNGWSDIGYHFLVDKLGNRFEGRAGSISSLPRGAHDGNNTNSFGFNVMGYMHTPHNQAPPLVQRNALYDLIAWRIPNPFTGFGSGSYAGKTVGFVAGHRNVGSTACPGDLMYQYIGTNYSGGEARLAVNSRITGGGGGATVTVDNTSAGFTPGTGWWAGSSTPGYYGSNYHTRPTEAISDAAKWTVNLPAADTYRVYAWWAAGSNRAVSAPYIITHNGGNSTVNVNQQANGGKWNELGSGYAFPSGSSIKVQLSCWTTAGFYVVADAVRFVQQ